MSSFTLQVAAGLSAVNAVLLLAVGAVWLRNYRTFRSQLVLGLVAFAAVLLLENLLALYFFFDMKMLYAADPSVHRLVATLRGLQLVALLFLTYVTTR